MKNLIFVVSLFLLSCTGKNHAYLAQDGDIVFHISTSSQSLAIQHATASPCSHMGIVLHKKGKPYVFEAVSIVNIRRFQPG